MSTLEPSKRTGYQRRCAKFLVGLLVLAAVIRLATIQYGTNVDEGVYWVEGKQLVDGYMIYQDTQFNKTPLAAVIAAAFFLFGDTPIYHIRLAMIAFSLLGLYAFYRLCRELFGETAACTALLIMVLEPFSCVWAKYLHTSTWTPWFEAGTFWFLVSGFKQSSRKHLFVSGVILGFYALSKQSAIYMLPTAFAGWLLFASQKSFKKFLMDAAVWGGGTGLIFLPFIFVIFITGTFPAMWHDIWTAHHKIAPWFAHHTLSFRLHEWRAIAELAPFLWIPACGSFVFFFRKDKRRELLFVWIWLLVGLCGNVIFFTHLWRHYLMVLMPPFAVLSALVWNSLYQSTMRKLNLNQEEDSVKPLIISSVIIAGLMIPFWEKNDWTYPGITLEQEKNLAVYVSRACKEPYLLNLTNPSLYVWADKEIPPTFQGERMTRIPYFMTLAGRGYSTREDMERTVEYWRTLPVNCVVSYGKYIPQIKENPVLEPIEKWLEEEFKPEPRIIRVSDSYYGWFLLYEKAGKTP